MFETKVETTEQVVLDLSEKGVIYLKPGQKILFQIGEQSFDYVVPEGKIFSLSTREISGYLLPSS